MMPAPKKLLTQQEKDYYGLITDEYNSLTVGAAGRISETVLIMAVENIKNLVIPEPDYRDSKTIVLDKNGMQWKKVVVAGDDPDDVYRWEPKEHSQPRIPWKILCLRYGPMSIYEKVR